MPATKYIHLWRLLQYQADADADAERPCLDKPVEFSLPSGGQGGPAIEKVD